jgi:Low psii accumulation1 / Rep27
VHTVTAMQDRDLEPLRERREWLDAIGRMKGGVSDSALVQLVRSCSRAWSVDKSWMLRYALCKRVARLQRSEAKAPFRLVRLIFLGGLLVGAVVGLLIITARLLQALQGGLAPPCWLCIASGLAKHGCRLS